MHSLPMTPYALLLCLAVSACPSAPAQTRPPSRVFVVNTQDASVSTVDLEEMKEIARHPVGSRPYGVAVTADGKTVAVGVEDEEKVKFFDAETFEPQGETAIGKMWNDHIVLTADGQHVLVANYHSNDIVGIDVRTHAEAFRISGTSAPHVIKLGPRRERAFATCKRELGIAIIDPSTRRLLQTHPLNVNPRSLTFAEDESKLYFASFWVDGIFEMNTDSGKVTRMIHLPPSPSNASPREVTYHGVEMVSSRILLAANEGRSYLDAIDVQSGLLLDRLTDGISSPCCVERIPGTSPPQVLVSNLGDGSLAKVGVNAEGKLIVLGTAIVGKAPKRVAFAQTSG
jgi:YVTN family beta-propeller protein